MGIPVIGFAGFSESGKTTLIERLLPILSNKGFRVSVVKHDAHDDIKDMPGTDTDRFIKAGAVRATIVTDTRTVTYGSGHESDLVLLEGFKEAPVFKIGVCRPREGVGLPAIFDKYNAIATPDTDLFEATSDCLIFSLDDYEGIADFISETVNRMRETNPPVELTHINEQGHARMVDVGAKEITERTAEAQAVVRINRQTLGLIRSGGMKKGDVLTVAQIAGIMGAKKTSDIIPMCHPIAFDGADITFEIDDVNCSIIIHSYVKISGRTGVEMEALTAASVAALTIYDMCKAVQKDIVIEKVLLVKKTGGVHGDYSINNNDIR